MATMDKIHQALLTLPTEVPDAAVKIVGDGLNLVKPYFDIGENALRKCITENVPNGPAYLETLDNFLVTNINTHAKQLPLMNPFHVLFIGVGYLLTIFVLRQFMRVLPDFKRFGWFTWVQTFHNLFLVLLSFYMWFEILRQAIMANYSIWFNPVDSSANGWPIAKIIWVFYISKIYEFGDTIIMVLRKNFRQVSFLHVYHHVSIFPVWWLVVFLAPGGESYFSAALNSFIHIIMYSYYFLSGIGISVPNFYKYSITRGQMLQFFTNFIQATANLIVGVQGYPRFLAWALFFYMLTLLALFANFLIQSTKRPKSIEGRKPSAKGASKGGKKNQ